MHSIDIYFSPQLLANLQRFILFYIINLFNYYFKKVFKTFNSSKINKLIVYSLEGNNFSINNTFKKYKNTFKIFFYKYLLIIFTRLVKQSINRHFISRPKCPLPPNSSLIRINNLNGALCFYLQNLKIE